MGRKGKGGGQPQEAQPVKEEPKEQIFDFNGKDANILQHFQSRLTDLVGQSSGYLESLPKAVQERVKALKNLHSKHVDLEKQFNAEVTALEKKYNALYAPLYDRRSTIVTGAGEPTAEELVEVKKEEESEPKKEETTAVAVDEGKDIKGIPEFWSSAIKHHPEFAQMTTERDEEALKHLVDLKVSTVEGEPHSFSLEFYFSDNEFFEDKLIKKTYILKESPEDGEVVYDHVDATEIKWKPGKNLCVKKVTRQQKGKGGRRGGRGGGGKPQSITVEQPCESFFNFFNPESAFEMLMGAEGMEEEDEDQFGPEGFQDFLEADYELGLEFKDKIIPHGVQWFTGEAALGYYMDEFGEEDEDDEEEEEDEDEEEEVQQKPRRAGKGGQQQQQQQGGQAAQPECKQQ
jgi:nucleosome assembly protein 1-like 1